MRPTALCLLVLLVCASVASAMTKTEAKDLARAVNLTPADMPGYSQTATDIGQLSDDPTFTDCAGTEPGSKFVGFFPSKTFERGRQSIYSEVDVLKSAELAAHDLAAYGSQRARRCLAKAIRASSGRELVRITVTALAPPVANGIGIRMASIVREGGKRVRVYSDVLFTGHDDVEVGVIASATGKPVPRSREDQLLNLVESRLSGRDGG